MVKQVQVTDTTPPARVSSRWVHACSGRLFLAMMMMRDITGPERDRTVCHRHHRADRA